MSNGFLKSPQGHYRLLVSGEYVALLLGLLVGAASQLGDCYASEVACEQKAQNMLTTWLVMVSIGIGLGVWAWFQAGVMLRARDDERNRERGNRTRSTLGTALLTLGPLVLLAVITLSIYSEHLPVVAAATLTLAAVVAAISRRVFRGVFGEPVWIGWAAFVVVALWCFATTAWIAGKSSELEKAQEVAVRFIW